MKTAEAILAEYHRRQDLFYRARRHADAVIAATEGEQKTPVEPLATMGLDGGPLLCDSCGVAMIIEGGPHDMLTVDESWRRDPTPGRVSYIRFGVVLSKEANGSLRVYHSYRKGCAGPVKTTHKREEIDLNLLSGFSDKVVSSIYNTVVVLSPDVGRNFR